MDFQNMLRNAAHAGGSVVRGTGNVARQMIGQEAPQDPAEVEAMIAELNAKYAADVEKANTPMQRHKFEDLDESLNATGLANATKWESDPANKDVPFEPGDLDYMVKDFKSQKQFRSNVSELEDEMERIKKEHGIDIAGKVKERSAVLQSLPKEQRESGIVRFAIAMGASPGEAGALLKTHADKNDSDNDKQYAHWKELLGIKSEAISAAIKQAAGEEVINVGKINKLLNDKHDTDKAARDLGGEMEKIHAKGEEDRKTTEVRGDWALRRVNSKNKAMLDAHGIDADGAFARQLERNSADMLNNLMKTMSDDDASDKVREWATDQVEKFSTGQKPSTTPSRTTVRTMSGVTGGGSSSGPKATAAAPKGTTMMQKGDPDDPQHFRMQPIKDEEVVQAKAAGWSVTGR